MKATPCELMAKHVLDDHVQHYHWIQSLSAEKSQLQFLDNYKGRRGFFFKKFLINDKFNLNNWRVTWEAIQKDIWGFVGLPVVLTPEIDHPPVEDQEDYRIGDIIDVGLDEINHLAWEVVHVLDGDVAQRIYIKSYDLDLLQS